MAKKSPARGKKTGPPQPDLRLLVTLGSIVVHADEYLSPGSHEFDAEVIRGLLRDPAVVAWIKAMGPLLPKKRV